MRTKKKVSITSNIIIAAKLAIKSDNMTPFGGLYSVFNRFRETRCSPGRLAGQTWKGGRFKIHTGVSPLAYRKKRLKGL